MDLIKKYGPIGFVGFGGAAVAGMLTKESSLVVKVLVGGALTGAAVLGGVKFGLLKI
jgi:hypothetical protein